MKNSKNPLLPLLWITLALLVCAVGLVGYTTQKQLHSANTQMTQAETKAVQKQQELQDTLTFLAEEEADLTKIQEFQDEIEDSDEMGEAEEIPMDSDPVQTEEASELLQESPDTQSIWNSPSSNGHMVAIDPGHQGEWVDMSALEPNGPGSSEMKARCSTGTSGAYTGLPEYQLNLDVSLKLEKILKERGYEVLLTRSDNSANISNMERAQLASGSGADIYVRIHANGEDSHCVSGALTMCPSPSNPYVSSLHDDSYRLSQSLLDAYCQATGFASHGVQYYDNMTGINWSEIPVTILEMGFMTYESDDRQMADASFQDIMAAGIADGIDAYFAQ